MVTQLIKQMLWSASVFPEVLGVDPRERTMESSALVVRVPLVRETREERLIHRVGAAALAVVVLGAQALMARGIAVVLVVPAFPCPGPG